MFIKILYLIAIHTYDVGFISICNGMTGEDAVDFQCYLQTVQKS